MKKKKSYQLIMLVALLISIVLFPISVLANKESAVEFEKAMTYSEHDDFEIPIFEAPDENNEAVTHLPSGIEVTILQTEESFSLIEYHLENDGEDESANIVQGYIQNEYLQTIKKQEIPTESRSELRKDLETDLGVKEEEVTNGSEEAGTSEQKVDSQKDVDSTTNGNNFFMQSMSLNIANEESIIGVAKRSPTNIRTEPSTKSKILKQLPIGSVIEVESYNEYWYQIEVNLNGKTQKGFIHEKHFTKVTPKPDTLHNGVAKREPTNIRAGASTKAKILSQFPIGTVFKYQEFSRNWYRVSVNVNGQTETGYIHRKHFTRVTTKPDTLHNGVAKKAPTIVRTGANEKSKVLRDIPIGTVFKYREFSRNWYEILVSVNGRTETGYIHRLDFTKVSAKPDTLYKGVAKREPTNIRVGASTKSNVLSQLPIGAVFKYQEFSRNWYRVSVNVDGRTRTGYIHRKHFTKVTEKPDTLYKGVAKQSPTIIRSGANTNSEVLTQLPIGAVFHFKEFSKNWHEISVQVNGRTQTGYIHRSHVTEIKTEPAPEVVVAIKNPTNVRAGVSTRAEILTQLNLGQVINVNTFSKNWYEVAVQVNGRTETGYIHRKHVDKEAVITSHYGTTFKRALDIQVNRSPKIQHSVMYVSKDALKQEDGKWIIEKGKKWEVKGSPNLTSETIGFLEHGVTTDSITVDESRSTDEFYRFRTQFILATEKDVRYYLDPNNFKPNTKEYYQFLVLSQPAGTSAKDLNEKILKGKGILANKGQSFINGANKYNINELYLIAHALHETGNGTSRLATGVEVGLNSNGDPVLVTESNRSSLTDIQTTYNMFGIDAVDSNPLTGGSIRAYNEGWFTPEAAIEGGAKFIGERYIHNTHKQDTLYKMKWNPSSPGYPQYATDVGWAVKQTTNLYNYYQMLDQYTLVFDIPSYR